MPFTPTANTYDALLVSLGALLGVVGAWLVLRR
jgi:hypothetical protein